MKRLGLFLVAILLLSVTVNSHAETVTSANVVGFATDDTSGIGTFEITFSYTGDFGDWEVGTWDEATGFTPFGASYFSFTYNSVNYETKAIDYTAGIIDFAIRYGGDGGTVWYLSEEDNPHTVIYSGENTVLGEGFYDQIVIEWDTGDMTGFKFEIGDADNTDSAFAPVPIPATALLFCSSILGIVGIRRKMSK